MKIIEASYKVVTPISNGAKEELKNIERIGRSCYGSEDKMTEESAQKFVRRLIEKGHWTPIEHSQLTVSFVVDRGISHEFARHRLTSFMQESTRYSDYGSDRNDRQITVIDPHPFLWRDSVAWLRWEDACRTAEQYYLSLRRAGAKPEMARSVLPSSLATHLTITANYREWHHILNLRTSENAHPQIRQVCVPLLQELQERIPVVFDDIPRSHKTLV